MKFFLVFLIFFSNILAQEKKDRIDIISNFDLNDVFIKNNKLETSDLSLKRKNLLLYKNSFDPLIKKVLFFNPPELFYNQEELKIFFQIPKQKTVLFLWEPLKLVASYYEKFEKVYTWDDDLIDNKKFFKFYYPFLMPMQDNHISFEKKKLCTLVASNWTEKRVSIINFFKNNFEKDFEFYGGAHFTHGNMPYNNMYKGPIRGFHSGQQKIDTLKKYKFCICFENQAIFNGYITEKIFCCFAAGCIPIYLGAKNIEKYIPKDCFIDYRDFKDDKQMYYFIKNMPEKDYNKYLDNIKKFLNSKKAQIFSKDAFHNLLINLSRN